MALTIILGGREYAAHTDTTVYPSGSPNIRSRMELHMAEDAMSLEEFAALMGDETNTMTIRLVGYHENESGEKVTDYDTAYSSYTYLSQVGKKRVQAVDNATGAVSEEYHLVAVLEQLTYTEQKLRQLGVI